MLREHRGSANRGSHLWYHGAKAPPALILRRPGRRPVRGGLVHRNVRAEGGSPFPVPGGPGSRGSAAAGAVPRPRGQARRARGCRARAPRRRGCATRSRSRSRRRRPSRSGTAPPGTGRLPGWRASSRAPICAKPRFGPSGARGRSRSSATSSHRNSERNRRLTFQPRNCVDDLGLPRIVLLGRCPLVIMTPHRTRTSRSAEVSRCSPRRQ